MPVMKAIDVAYVRFSAPDIGVMRDFLSEFGMSETPGSDGALYMRGNGVDPFVHVTEPGEPAFLAFGIQAASLDDLRRLAEHDGKTVEPLAAPGGGFVVRLVDPDGHGVEVVAGQTPAEPGPTPPAVIRNEGGGAARAETRRIRQGPSHVMRLGHVVLGVSNFRASEAWYKERFGFLTSDEIQAAPGVSIGAFMRADRGAEPSDHHTLFIIENPAGPGYMHAAFEVFDFDDLMAGHQHLARKTHQHHWGVGRHYLGSQIFDYWRDPWGHEIEHWTDGDRLTADVPPGVGSLQELMGVQWGMEMPPVPGFNGPPAGQAPG